MAKFRDMTVPIILGGFSKRGLSSFKGAMAQFRDMAVSII